MSREEAYAIVQSCAHTAWNQPTGNFQAAIEQNPKVKETLSAEEIAECFDPQHHLKNLDVIFQRLNI
jgi:adenylosuccinate lyase